MVRGGFCDSIRYVDQVVFTLVLLLSFNSLLCNAIQYAISSSLCFEVSYTLHRLCSNKPKIIQNQVLHILAPLLLFMVFAMASQYYGISSSLHIGVSFAFHRLSYAMPNIIQYQAFVKIGASYTLHRLCFAEPNIMQYQVVYTLVSLLLFKKIIY